MEHRMSLGDDGTLDTVIVCKCGATYRYTFDSSVIEGSLSQGMSEYNDFVDWAIDDASDQHDADLDAANEQ